MAGGKIDLANGAGLPSSRFFDEIDEESSELDESNRTGPLDLFETKAGERLEVNGQISGRVPASNGAMGLIHGLDSNLGAGMRIALFRGLKEVGLGFVESIYENSGGDYELAQGTALALKYEEKSYESGSRYVKEDPVRKACDDAFRRDGRDVVWVETKGIAEMGGGEGGTLPLGGLIDLQTQVQVSGLIRYRRFEPFESASGTLLSGQAFSNTANIPITASLARRIPPGGEFEFAFESNVDVIPEISKPYGVKDKLGSLGASAGIKGKRENKFETVINVQRLPFGDEVLVRVSKKNAHTNSLGASLKAGLELKRDAVDHLPEIGKGFLKFALDRLKLPDAVRTVRKFFQSRIQIKARSQDNEVETARYVFDLSKPNIRKAYEAIFTGFSLAQAQALVEQKEDGIRAQRAGEKVHLWEKGAAAVLGPTKVFLLSALQAQREGKVSADGKSDIVYRDTHFEKTYVNWFHGEQKIKWEAVTVDGVKGQQEKQNYFHLLYTNSDRMTTEKEIESLLKFAKGIGIPTDRPDEESQIHPEVMAKVLADRDDTNTRVDVYFTDQGLKNISMSSKENAQNAYLKAYSEIEGKPIDAKNPILSRFLEISNMWFFQRIFFYFERRKLRDEYARIESNRSIDEDSQAFFEAKAFAERVALIKSDEASLKEFFLSLARKNGFQFMRSIAALTRLASIQETIVHELSISGGGLTLAAVDEGEILHPEKAMHRMLTKIA